MRHVATAIRAQRLATCVTHPMWRLPKPHSFRCRHFPQTSPNGSLTSPNDAFLKNSHQFKETHSLVFQTVVVALASCGPAVPFRQEPQLTQFVLHHGLSCNELFWFPIILLACATGTLLVLAIRGAGHRTNHFLVCPFADRVVGSLVFTAATNDSSSLVSAFKTAGSFLSRCGGRI